jgi:energy-converting hydrogenase Eha subunit E
MTPTVFIIVDILAGIVVAMVGVSLLMYVFAATLFLTTGIAVSRSIPRKEK